MMVSLILATMFGVVVYNIVLCCIPGLIEAASIAIIATTRCNVYFEPISSFIFQCYVSKMYIILV